MRHCGLLNKANGAFVLTSFGRVIFHYHLALKDTIINEYWKLKAMDVLIQPDTPKSQCDEIVGILIENENLRQILSKWCSYENLDMPYG